MEEIIANIINYLPESWEGWITMVIAVCAALGACWPRPSDDAHVIWRGLYSLVNALGANFGKAKNADDARAALGLTSTIKPAARPARKAKSMKSQPSASTAETQKAM